MQTALANRPDLKSANQSLDVDDLQIRKVRNDFLPDLSLTGMYTAQGRGGNIYNSGFPGVAAAASAIP